MRLRTLTICAVAVGAVLCGTTAASAATKPPGYLRPQDIPGNFQQVALPTTYATFSGPVVDSATCTETPKSFDGVSGALNVYFSRVGATPPTTALYEFVVSYVNAKAAQASFRAQAASAAAGAKCGTVGFVPPGTTAAIDTQKITALKVAKAGTGTFAHTTMSSSATLPVTSVTFVRGPYVVTVGTPGVADAPTAKDLAKVVARADKRLPVSTPIPSTTSTTSTPLVVDPVASRCAEESGLVSSGSTPTTITFVNKTTQPLRVYWVNTTGARQAYGEVAPGATVNQGTFVGHVWVLADSTDRCVQLTVAAAPATTMTVNG